MATLAKLMASTPQTTVEDSAADAGGQDGADVRWVVVSIVVFAVGWLLLRDSKASAVTLKPDVGVFALLYIAAQAIERLLEPLVSLDPFKLRFEQVRNAAAAAAGASDAAAVTKAQAELNRWKSNRSVVIWSLASVAGMIFSATFGVFIIAMVVATPEGQAAPDRALDIAITGLVIGGGTKPLHDLITRVQASSTNATKADSGSA